MARDAWIAAARVGPPQSQMKNSDLLIAELTSLLPHGRVVSDPLRTFAYGTDASFYRLVPRVVAIVDSESELNAVQAVARAHRAPLTFRAAGTSLSGQAITDSILILLGEAWKGAQVLDDGAAIRLGPAVRGGEANRLLAPYGRKIGPDPASIESAQIGGIAANNASGMCCGTRDNSYHTLRAMRIVLVDGTVLDTDDATSVSRFRESRADLLAGLSKLSRQVRRDPALTARIRHKYRLKNTTGYGLNALIDFEDPIDIASHLMIGSEGTLGFISSVTYRTVADHAIKAASLLLFDDLHAACAVVTQLAKAPVAAVELMDRAALASVEGKPGMPDELATLGAEGAALLVETRAADQQGLEDALQAIQAVLAASGTARPWRFTREAAEIAQLWKLRKGTFPSVGAMRRTGTTVVIEDVAFPVERLADATIDLQRTLHKHGYHEAIIFGHALAGNLHFVFTQDFASQSEVARYAALIDDVVELVVGRYDGSLKAEHGTGRNMAPFVEREWGIEGAALMREIKRLFDPDGLLNPDVILSSDPQAHLRHLKALPAADPIVDKCIECGFCEPVCPSAGLTLSPRQRITSWREIQRRQASGEDGSGLLRAYQYAGIDTCAACGLCATVCPVGIETGRLIKSLRATQASPLASAVGRGVASRFGATTGAVRLGLKVVDGVHGALGTTAMTRVTSTARALSGKRLPQWTAAMPRAAKKFTPAKGWDGERVVYFPSCASRTMGPARGDPIGEDLRCVTERVLRRAGYQVIFPRELDGHCCGQPFESKGLSEGAAKMASGLESALRDASEDGALPIVFDTSPCAYRMKQMLAGRLPVHDLTEFLHDEVLPRLTLQRSPAMVALHPVCSVTKMGLRDKLAAIAGACAETVVVPPDVSCCGWAGDRGFTVPELNAHALRTLKSALPAACSSGYSTSRTCEIGLTVHSGIDYRSIVYLVDAASAPR
jgi:D-lactate dehydrogenase